MSRRTSPIRLVFALLLAASGCASDADVLQEGPTSDKLSESTAVPFVEEGSAVRLVVRLGSYGIPTPTEIRIEEGWIVIRAENDGSLVLDSLDVAVEDLVFGEAGGAFEGIHLTDIRASLAEPVVLETEWFDDGTAALGTAQIAVKLDWSLLADSGDALPLTTQHIEEIRLQVHTVIDAEGALAVSIAADRSGIFWTWSQQVELLDLALEADALER